MAIVNLYKKIDGEVSRRKADLSQIKKMESVGWSRVHPDKVKKEDNSAAEKLAAEKKLADEKAAKEKAAKEKASKTELK